jgi:hypothetical protein
VRAGRVAIESVASHHRARVPEAERESCHHQRCQKTAVRYRLASMDGPTTSARRTPGYRTGAGGERHHTSSRQRGRRQAHPGGTSPRAPPMGRAVVARASRVVGNSSSALRSSAHGGTPATSRLPQIQSPRQRATPLRSGAVAARRTDASSRRREPGSGGGGGGGGGGGLTLELMEDLEQPSAPRPEPPGGRGEGCQGRGGVPGRGPPRGGATSASTAAAAADGRGLVGPSPRSRIATSLQAEYERAMEGATDSSRLFWARNQQSLEQAKAIDEKKLLLSYSRERRRGVVTCNEAAVNGDSTTGTSGGMCVSSPRRRWLGPAEDWWKVGNFARCAALLDDAVAAQGVRSADRPPATDRQCLLSACLPCGT